MKNREKRKHLEDDTSGTEVETGSTYEEMMEEESAPVIDYELLHESTPCDIEQEFIRVEKAKNKKKKAQVRTMKGT